MVGPDGRSSNQDSDTADLAQRLDLVPSLRHRTRVEVLDGGITNRNFRIETPQGVVVARLSAPDGSLLGIDRVAEHANTVRAHTSGAGPAVVDHSSAAGILVVAWVEGRTYGAEDLRDTMALTRIADSCRTLHAGPRFVGDFDMFDIQRRYLSAVHERGLRLPDGYEDFAPTVAAVEAALTSTPVATVPCHNDLLPANIIDDGTRLWLIDYEYAGNNDPSFELGNIWSEATLAPDLLDHLVEAYWGHPSTALVARARLWALISKYGWMLWAVLQQATSELDFDFWSWGMEKYDRAASEFTGPHLATWLNDVSP